MDRIPVIIFDTSAINYLSKEQHCKGLVAALRHGFYTRVLATNFEEIAATVRSEERRALLVSVPRSLLTGGDCILPFNWLLDQHIQAFESNPSYNWQQVPVCPPDLAETLLRDKSFFCRELAVEQLSHAQKMQGDFEAPFERIRPEFEEMFRSHGRRIVSFAELLQVMFSLGGSYWAIGAELYRHAAGNSPEEEKIRRFAACTPFHSLLVANARAQYERCVAVMPATNRKRLANRVDTFMA
ncbi:MAG: hypothetical protein WBX19_15475, partial [Terracidiphilus sp.]